MKTLKIGLLSCILAAPFLFLPVFTPKACPSGRCGECYNTGVAGRIVWVNGSQDCEKCE